MGFGIYTRLYKGDTVSHACACSCGNKYITKNKNHKICDKCGNGIFEYVFNGRSDMKIKNVKFKIIKEDLTGFIAERDIDNYICSTDDEATLEFKNTTGKYRMIMDFKNKDFHFEDSKGNNLDFNSGRVQYFLRTIDNSDKFINSFKTQSIRELLKTTKFLHLNKNGWYYSFTKGLGAFVRHYESYESCQVLANCGFNASFIVTCIHKEKINTKATKPNEILGISKCVFKILKEFNLNYECIQYLTNLEKLGGENIRYINSKIKDECGFDKINNFLSHSEEYMELIDRYKYDNRRLINYLTREVKLQQGIDNPVEALTLLKDTNRMCRDMEVKIKEKYPKSLKKDHDIARLNYKINSDVITEKRFNKVVSDDTYNKLKFKNKEYIVLAPDKPSDLIKEGDSLSHCVSSYIKDVCDERCNIYFIRDIEEQDKSLLTVEVRNDKIMQVRGQGNRYPTGMEKSFINQWAMNKNLKIN